MSDRTWPERDNFKGYVTTLSSIGSGQPAEVEMRLGFGAGSLSNGYALYTLDAPVGLNEFEWRDTTRYSGGWKADPTIEFGTPPIDGTKLIWSVQRRDELRAELGKKLGYDEAKVDAELDKVMRAALNRLSVRQGSERIVKLLPMGKVSSYPDSPFDGVPQWELKSKKSFKLLNIVFDEATARQLSGNRWWHTNQDKYPNSEKINALLPVFADKVQKFVNALRKAGADVYVSATLRNPARAKLMYYSHKLSRGEMRTKEIPKIDGCDIVWDHGNEKLSQAAAKEMAELFKVVYEPSLASLHIPGKAIDMTIKWTKTITIVDANGRDVKIAGPGNGASSAALHKVGASYGVIKLLKDAPHWSINGH
jgi:hypothetical protein